MFDTYGPCDWHLDDDFDDFIAEIKSLQYQGLEDGVGVYIIAAEESDGSLTPWYVGQTYIGFRRRFWGHYKRGRFDILKPTRHLKVFLIALAKKGQPRSPKPPGSDRFDRKCIDFLELDLINCCRKVNTGLLNVRDKKFLENLFVGGYRESVPVMEELAYAALAGMLNGCKRKN